MGPQLDSCGRPLKEYSAIEKGTLQWGRNLTVAEGAHSGIIVAHAKRLQWGRNLTVAEGSESLRCITQRQAASMGPQLDSCGRAEINTVVAAITELQWGRNLTVAEGCIAFTTFSTL